MSEEQSRDYSDRERSHRAEHGSAESEAGPAERQNPGTQPSYPGSLLGDPNLNGHCNQPVRAALMTQMQQTYGNRALQRFFRPAATASSPVTVVARTASHDGPATTALDVPPGAYVQPPLRVLGPEGAGTSVQRQDASDQGASQSVAEGTGPDPRRALAERIVADVRRGGISVAVYAFHNVSKAREFEVQAKQYALDHRTIGVSGGTLGEGVAMEMNPSLPAVLDALNRSIEELLASYPDLSPNESTSIPIQTLAIFTHGLRTGLQAGKRGKYIHMRQLESWVQAIVPYLSPSPHLPLFACSTAGEPPRGVPFAEAIQESLQAGLEERYGPDTEVAPDVWAHTVSGHTTANVHLAEIPGEPGSTERQLLPDLGGWMADLAIEHAGRTGSLTETQRRNVRKKAEYYMLLVLAPPEHVAPDDPLNTYIREIPQRGIDRVWIDLTTPGTPDLSGLDLTPEAMERAAEGLQIFQERFRSRLSDLERYVNSLRVRTRARAGTEPAGSSPAASNPNTTVEELD